MNPIHTSLAEYQTQTDFDVLCEQSVESKGGGGRSFVYKPKGKILGAAMAIGLLPYLAPNFEGGQRLGQYKP